MGRWGVAQPVMFGVGGCASNGCWFTEIFRYCSPGFGDAIISYKKLSWTTKNAFCGFPQSVSLRNLPVDTKVFDEFWFDFSLQFQLARVFAFSFDTSFGYFWLTFQPKGFTSFGNSKFVTDAQGWHGAGGWIYVRISVRKCRTCSRLEQNDSAEAGLHCSGHWGGPETEHLLYFETRLDIVIGINRSFWWFLDPHFILLGQWGLLLVSSGAVCSVYVTASCIYPAGGCCITSICLCSI